MISAVRSMLTTNCALSYKLAGSFARTWFEIVNKHTRLYAEAGILQKDCKRGLLPHFLLDEHLTVELKSTVL